MRVEPRQVILVHGDHGAKQALQSELRARFPVTRVTIG
jgi:predicted metal-dependent RNase